MNRKTATDTKPLINVRRCYAQFLCKSVGAATRRQTSKNWGVFLNFFKRFFKQIQVIFFRIHNSLSGGKKFNENTKYENMYDFCKKLDVV